MAVSLREPVTLTLCCEEIPVLTASVTLPQGPGRRFKRYYDRCAAALERRCRQELLPQAQQAFHDACRHSAALPDWQLRHTASLYESGPCLSVRRETRLTGTAPTLHGEVWDLEQDLLLPLSALFPSGPAWRLRLLKAAAQRLGIPPRQLLPHFRRCRFCVTAEGLLLIFPTWEGRTATVPYDSETGPRLPVYEKKC